MRVESRRVVMEGRFGGGEAMAMVDGVALVVMVGRRNVALRTPKLCKACRLSSIESSSIGELSSSSSLSLVPMPFFE